ncbi:transglycosylase SLT domain-containing protein [Rhizobium sp. YIM 134829]|uniref:transglycosylase SLT domain-containing protein n=1 Tax=Rhizobium sp. YIM 134829 TaxID=3390453 RepID=UPI0039793882
MADFRFSLSKPALKACALLSVASLAACSSVERTPLEQLTAAQTVTPIAKPGTEMTAYALPTPDGAATSTAAALAAETAMMTPGTTGAAAEQTAQAAATSAVPASNAPTALALAPTPNAKAGPASLQAATLQPAPAPLPAGGEVQMASLAVKGARPGAVMTDATAEPLPASTQAIVTVDTVKVPFSMASLSMRGMDSDFDTGEPVGLENLVVNRMIVPSPKPNMISAAYAKVEDAATSLLGRPKPTSNRPELDRLIAQYAKLNEIPEELVHRVVKRESTYNPRAYHNGNYGLMQIRYNTAKSLGYEGPPEGLFDAETNLKYATQYLRGAWMVADNKNDHAVRLYASGYYYTAKRKGLLDTLNMR